MGNADKTILTPPGWTWQEEHGFVQGRAIPAASRTVYVAGQASMDDKGNPVHKGNMEAQIIQAFGNLETVVAQAGGSLSNVVKVTFFTTDIEAFFAAEKALVQHLTQRDCHPTSTLVEIARLAHPDLLFEVEAIAVV